MKNILSKKWFKILLICIGFILIISIYDFIHYYDYRQREKREEQFYINVEAILAKEIDMNDIVPFEWDIAYAYYNKIEEKDFDEYTNHLLKEVSFEPRLSELYVHLVFAKDNKVVLGIRLEKFNITNDEMKEGLTEIFSFFPTDSIFTVSKNEYGKIVLTHKSE